MEVALAAVSVGQTVVKRRNATDASGSGGSTNEDQLEGCSDDQFLVEDVIGMFSGNVG